MVKEELNCFINWSQLSQIQIFDVHNVNILRNIQTWFTIEVSVFITLITHVKHYPMHSYKTLPYALM